MSNYILTEMWQPIKERSGILRNVSDSNIMWAITRGTEPASGQILEPKHLIPFDLHDTVMRPPHIVPPPPFPYKPPRRNTLFVKAVSVTEADPTPTVIVDGERDNHGVDYNVSGLTMWMPDKVYAVNQFVEKDGELYRAKHEHVSDAEDFNEDGYDTSKWEKLYEGVLNEIDEKINMMEVSTAIKEWSPDKKYSAGDVVIYNDTLYYCKVDNPSSPFNVNEWQIIGGTVIEGGGVDILDWVSGTEYAIGDLVNYNNVLHQCTEANNDTEFDEEKWTSIGALNRDLTEWQQNTSYSAGALVIYNNNLYKCIEGNTDDSFTPDKWKLILEGDKPVVNNLITKWVADTSYAEGALVIYNNKIYECIVANNDATFNSNNWEEISVSEKMSFLDDWKAKASYIINDVVRYSNGCYVCIASHTSADAFQTDYDSTAPKWYRMDSHIDSYKTNTFYGKGVTVEYNNKIYKCLTSHTSTSDKMEKVGNAVSSAQATSDAYTDSWDSSTSNKRLTVMETSVFTVGTSYYMGTVTVLGSFNAGTHVFNIYGGNSSSNVNTLVKTFTFSPTSNLTNYNLEIPFEANFAYYAINVSSATASGSALTIGWFESSMNKWKLIGEPNEKVVVEEKNDTVVVTDWKANTKYTKNQLVKYGSNIYACLEDHTSEAEFDEAKWSALGSGGTGGGSGLPIGTPILLLVNDKIPEGFLLANGASLERAMYPQLFEWFGTTYGAEDDEHFNLPNINDGRFFECSDVAGVLKEAGLPNIEGEINSASNAGLSDAGTSGALVRGSTFSKYLSGSVGNGYAIRIDASLSNPIYGASGTVQPKSITVRVAIKAFDATVNEGLIDITQLANKVNNTVGVPIGTKINWIGKADAKIPAGFLVCNGASLRRDAYPALFDAIGTEHGAVDNEHFNLPNTNGNYLIDAGENENGWWRLYADGWCEQGGHTPFNTSGEGVSCTSTISLPKAYKDTSFVFLDKAGGSWSDTFEYDVIKTTDTVTVIWYGLNNKDKHDWYACGYTSTATLPPSRTLIRAYASYETEEAMSVSKALNDINRKMDLEKDFTIIYPNGGTAENPANVTVNSRYVMDNPFPNYAVNCKAEILIDGKWMKSNPSAMNNQWWGILAEQDSYGRIGVYVSNYITQNYFAEEGMPSGRTTPTPCRVKVWKVGRIA